MFKVTHRHDFVSQKSVQTAVFLVCEHAHEYDS